MSIIKKTRNERKTINISIGKELWERVVKLRKDARELGGVFNASVVAEEALLRAVRKGEDEIAELRQKQDQEKAITSLDRFDTFENYVPDPVNPKNGESQ